MTQLINLPAQGEVLIAGDDLEFAAALSYEGSPLNLGSVTSVTAVLKQTATATDASGTTYTVGHGLTVTNSEQGELTWNVPRADVGANRWYRIYVTDTSSRNGTALAGRLILQDG